MATQQYEFPYGKASLTLNWPGGLDLVELHPQPMPALPFPLDALKDHLNSPFGRPPLRVLAKDAHECVIVVADHQEYVAYELWLPALLTALNEAGIPDGRISLYVASGLRRPMSPDEKERTFGAEACRRVREIVDHDIASQHLIKVGRTDFGTVIWADERLFKSEMLIITGAIQYHHMAGYTGGRSAIMPGVVGQESIVANLRRAIDPETRGLRKDVGPGLYLENPVSEDMHEACTLLKPNLTVNFVINNERKPAWVNAGDYGYIHRLGAKFLDDHNRVTVKEPVDIAILGCGGFPRDNTLWQAAQCLRQVEHVLKPGATVIYVAECIEGMGPEEMQRWADASLDECKHRIMVMYQGAGITALELKQMAQDFNLHIVSALPQDVCAQWGLTAHDSLDHALSKAMPMRPDLARWLLCSDISNLLAVLPG